MNKLLTSLLFSAIIFSAFAQHEAIVSLKHHPRLNEKTNAAFWQKKAHMRAASLTLPFFDDFYQPDIFPDPALWQDNFVYINRTYTKHPVTIGVASFDGTDANGKPYTTNVG